MPGPESPSRRLRRWSVLTLALGCSCDDGLVDATGLAIGSDGFYVSNFGASSGQGEVLRITAAIPEPTTYALMLAGLGAIGWLTRRRTLDARTA